MTRPQAPIRYNVLGVGVSALNLRQTCGMVLAAREARGLGYICATGVHGVSEAQADERVREILNGAWLNVPDGMPLVWLGHWSGHSSVSRVYGPDLMLAVCDEGRAVGLKHYFYGGVPGVAEALKEKLCARFPGLKVVGTFTPPFRPLNPEETEVLRSNVCRTQPDVFWVGLSTPKQERFMAEHGLGLDTGVLIGVGAAFDFHSGRVRQAPRWVQRSGTEWLFRVCQEPRRLWRRYLINNTLFLWRITLQLSGLRKYPLVLPSSAG
jgi:N-acetylglucosaminyldiphosphoundecaprenol N-acetyl-beta-D-mannosaminyltransferase